MLEDSLRQALSEQVELTPAATGRADAVIRRGRAASKRRRVYTGLAAVLSFAMLIVGVTFWQTLVRPAGSMTFSADPTALPEPAPTASIDERSPPAASTDERSAPPASTDERPVPVESIDLALVAGIGLDIRVGNRLLTVDGRRLDLVGVGDVDRVVRVPAGWVYGGRGAFQVLAHDGTGVIGGGDAEAWTVSTDGRRVAYVTDTVLTVAEMWRNEFVTKAHVTVPAGSSPVALVGTKVLISGQQGAAYVDVGADVGATPTWDPSVRAVFGTGPHAVTGLVNGDCLAALTPGATGVVTETTPVCGLVRPNAASSLSPQGDWLVEATSSGMRFVNVNEALAGRAVDKACAAAGVRATAWVNPITVAAAYAGGVVRCNIHGARVVVAKQDKIGKDWQLVPRLGSFGG
jgi:hypothetical protein